jgi:hypothetical protein
MSAAAAKHLLFSKTVVRLSQKNGRNAICWKRGAAASSANQNLNAYIANAFLESGAPRFISSAFLHAPTPLEDERALFVERSATNKRQRASFVGGQNKGKTCHIARHTLNIKKENALLK